jgi:hypothetical protein
LVEKGTDLFNPQINPSPFHSSPFYFKIAIKAKDWTVAAKESNRKPPISAERNKYVKDLLEKAAVNSKATSTAKP